MALSSRCSKPTNPVTRSSRPSAAIAQPRFVMLGIEETISGVKQHLIFYSPLTNHDALAVAGHRTGEAAQMALSV
jgi:hypothetical protein